MKKSVLVFIAMSLFANFSMAECDFSTGISKQENGYLYTRECNLKVGEMKRDLLISQEQIAKLNQSLDLKDLAIDKSNQRVILWQDTAFKIEERVNTIDDMRKSNQILYFGLGVLTMFAATYAAGQLK